MRVLEKSHLIHPQKIFPTSSRSNIQTMEQILGLDTLENKVDITKCIRDTENKQHFLTNVTGRKESKSEPFHCYLDALSAN